MKETLALLVCSISVVFCFTYAVGCWRNVGKLNMARPTRANKVSMVRSYVMYLFVGGVGITLTAWLIKWMIS